MNFTPFLTMSLCIFILLMIAYVQLFPANAQSWPLLSIPSPNADVILYSYFETPEAFKNFNFFMRHALHAKADFIIMLNGNYTIDVSSLQGLRNVRVVERENRCYDLGGFHEILTRDPRLVKQYKRFMFTNASLRGPFFPPWASHICWSDAYWDKLQSSPNGTKVVGMTWNCANGTPYPPHLQSMILAFDQRTLTKVFLPWMKCYSDKLSAIEQGELLISKSVQDAGGEIFAMESRFAAHAGPDGRNSSAFLEWCVDSPEEQEQGVTHWNDVLNSQRYEGTTIHPYETM